MKEKQKKKKRSLSREIMVLTMAALVGSLFLLGTSVLFVFAFVFYDNTRQDITYVMQNINQQFRDRMQFIEDGAIAIRHNVVLQEFFEGTGEPIEDGGEALFSGKESQAGEQLSYAMDLFSPSNMVDRTPFAESVYLFNNYGEYIYKYYYPLTSAAVEEKERIYKEIVRAFQDSGRQYASFSEKDEIYLCFLLYDEAMEECGICVVDIQKEAVRGLFEEVETYQNWAWCVYDEEQVLASGGDAGLVQQIAAFESENGEEDKAAENRVIIGRAAGSFRIQSASAVGTENLYLVMRPTLIIFMIALLVAMVFAALLAFALSFRFTRSLKKVRESMQAFGEEKLDVRMEELPVQEFDEVRIVFNEMAERIQYLITQVYEKQLLATQHQVKYLQAQITPHFQFNILAMLGLKAKLAGNEEVYQGIRAFSELIRGKIFRSREIKIPVSEELELVSFYLYLQNSRFHEKITYEIKCSDEGIKNDMIPRLLIEPLVENAVSHGLEPKQGPGEVIVSLFEEGEWLHIVVEDNGVGFEEQEEPEQKRVHEQPGHTHTGLENTKRLLQILYQEKYQWILTGKKGEGTRVEIVIPIERGQ